MKPAQLTLLVQRFIKDPQKYSGVEPEKVKIQKDLDFCKAFFGYEEIKHTYIMDLLNDSICTNNELELDLLLILLTHFHCVKHYCVTLAPLLIQPWHHLHDRIAGMLEFESDERIIEYLYQGSIYRCENLEYESDYCEFNRKCLFALAKIGTHKAITYVKTVSTCENTIIAKHALTIIKEYSFA